MVYRGTRVRHSLAPALAQALAVAVASAATLAAPTQAQLMDAPDALRFEIAVEPNSRAEVFLGQDPRTILICLVAGARVTIDISSQRNSRSILERDECVLVNEREVFATVSTGDPSATIEVIVPRL